MTGGYDLKPYTSKAKKAIDLAARISKKMNYSYVGTEHILAGLIKEGTGVAAEVLTACNVEYDKLISMIEDLISPGDNIEVMDRDGYSPRTQRVLERASEEADRLECNEIGTEHLLMAIVLQGDCAAARLLNTMGVNSQKMFIDILGAMGEDPSAYRDLMKSYGTSYNSATPVLDQYSRDLTDMAEAGLLDPVIGRKKEMERVIQILCRRKNNPCLIGEPGVGKTAIVEGLAQDIVSGNVPDILLGKRLVSLDMSGLVAKSKYRGEFEERIKKVISEVSNAKNVLLFIDELHTIIGAGGAEGSLDASNILKPALARGEVQVIGATTIEEYRKYVEKDAALERRFQPVMVEEPGVDETIEILTGLKGIYEKHHGVIITDEGVKAAVNLSARYINDRFLPDKAIDLMDEAAARIRLKNLTSSDELLALKKEITDKQNQVENALSNGDLCRRGALWRCKREVLENKQQKLIRKNRRTGAKNQPVVGENEIADVVSGWTKIPVNKLTESEAGRLAKLEQILHKRVIGQEEAVSAVAKAVRRGRVGLKDPKKPIGSFLFLGPTGVGKTEVSKALAEAVFGKEDAMIRVDMSEYMEKHSVSKMIGSPPGYKISYEEGRTAREKVRRNPFSVILFDEIEKAHPDVFNILLQVLDDGRITDSQGRTVDFKNTIIIMTSNAGASSIIEPKRLGFGAGEDEKQDHERMKNSVMEEVRRIFKPEFLNRIDETIVFRALNKDDMKHIVTLLVKELKKRCKEQLDIELTVRDSAKSFIVDKAYDRKYGARPLKRKLQEEIEDRMSEDIITGKIKRGNKVIISTKNKQISLTVE